MNGGRLTIAILGGSACACLKRANELLLRTHRPKSRSQGLRQVIVLLWLGCDRQSTQEAGQIEPSGIPL